MQTTVSARSSTLAADASAAPPEPLAETRATLIEGARRRFGAIPAEVLVDHVLERCGASDFAVRAAAMEALERRWTFAEREGLTVATRPGGDAVLGAYTTSRHGVRAKRKGKGKDKGGGRARGRRFRGEARPYTTVLEDVRPIAASCDCPDFVRSSLGVCKHALVVLDFVFGSRAKLARAGRERDAIADRRSGASTARLGWDPVLPLSGELDRVAGLRLEVGGRARLSRVADAFVGGRVARAVLGDVERRRELLASLNALISAKADAKRGSAGRARVELEASPSARAIVVEELERAERRARCAKAAAKAVPHLRSLARRLYPYQREGVERFLSTGRLLLADDMGLGKTTQAIAACHALFESRAVRRGLVIAPASLKPQWLREWQETTRVPVAVVDGTPEARARQYRDLDEGFLILNYEQLLRDAEHVSRLAPEIVVLDEAQRIKNYATKSAAYVKALTPAYRLALTGTPMENRLEELASVLDWIDDVALAPKWRLVPWHTESAGDGSAGGSGGARNLVTLRTRLAGCLLRRVRKEVLDQLPARTDTRLPVEMTPQQTDAHDELTLPIARLVQRSKKRPLSQPEFLRLMQLLTQQRIIANGLGQLRFDEIWPAYRDARPDAMLLEGLFAPKLIELRRLLGDLVLEQGRKVVVFSQWRRMLRLCEWSVRDVLAARGLRGVFFTGAEKPSQRTRSVVDFHDDPRTAVMFLTDAGGVGLNLQRAASACINLEMPWNPAVLEQRIGRIYRLGQKQPIDVFNLVSEGSIEARIAGLVGAKQALFSGLFDGTTDEVRFDCAPSMLTRVERLVEPSAAADLVERGDGAAPADEGAAIDGSDGALADQVPAAAPTPAPIDRGMLPAMFDAVRVERLGDGGIRIEAPPEVAGTLLSLFEGMSKLLASCAPRPS